MVIYRSSSSLAVITITIIIVIVAIVIVIVTVAINSNGDKVVTQQRESNTDNISDSNSALIIIE